jgi:hypothetical protein
VNQWKWVNQFQPQTLYMATILCYIDAVFGLLFGGFASPIGLFVIAALGAGGFGIANEKRWGYILGVVVSSLAVVLFVLWPLVNDLGVIFSLAFLLNILFPVALFCLLVHPMSREYQKIWFH